jgi:hypothetical protein
MGIRFSYPAGRLGFGRGRGFKMVGIGVDLQMVRVPSAVFLCLRG